MCSSSLTAAASGEQAPLQQPLWPGTRRRFGMDPAGILFKASWFGQIRDISAAAPLQGKWMVLSIWAQNTPFVVLDFSRTQVWWVSVIWGLQHENPDCPTVGVSALSGQSQIASLDTFWELTETQHRQLLEVSILWLLQQLKEKEGFIKTPLIQFTLRIQPFLSMLTLEVLEKENSILSMQKCSSTPVPSSPPPWQEFYLHPASALTQTYLFLHLGLRAVEPWAELDMGISVSLLHAWCLPCILLLFSKFLPAWQAGRLWNIHQECNSFVCQLG